MEAAEVAEAELVVVEEAAQPKVEAKQRSRVVAAEAEAAEAEAAEAPQTRSRKRCPLRSC